MTSIRTRMYHMGMPLALLLLVACTTPPPDEGNLRSGIEAHISANIVNLSPVQSTMGGTFYVTNFSWLDEDTVIVSYEDGHMAYQAEADVALSEREIRVLSFPVYDNERSGSAAESGTSIETGDDSPETMTAGIMHAGMGERCGGGSGTRCKDGMLCHYAKNDPFMGGTCMQQ